MNCIIILMRTYMGIKVQQVSEFSRSLAESFSWFCLEYLVIIVLCNVTEFVFGKIIPTTSISKFLSTLRDKSMAQSEPVN